MGVYRGRTALGVNARNVRTKQRGLNNRLEVAIQNGSLVHKGWRFYNAKYGQHIKNHVTSHSRCVYSQVSQRTVYGLIEV